MCAFVLQGECGAIPPSFAFTVNVGAHAPITAPKSVSVPRNANELRIVHITDLHYDPHYQAGARAGDCINPVCCRRNDGISPNPADGAGRWGDYRVSLRSVPIDKDLLTVFLISSVIHHGKPSKTPSDKSALPTPKSILSTTLATSSITASGRRHSMVTFRSWTASTNSSTQSSPTPPPTSKLNWLSNSNLADFDQFIFSPSNIFY